MKRGRLGGKNIAGIIRGAEEDLVNSVISVLDSGREKFLFRKYNFNRKYGIRV